MKGHKIKLSRLLSARKQPYKPRTILRSWQHTTTKPSETPLKTPLPFTQRAPKVRNRAQMILLHQLQFTLRHRYGHHHQRVLRGSASDEQARRSVSAHINVNSIFEYWNESIQLDIALNQWKELPIGVQSFLLFRAVFPIN